MDTTQIVAGQPLVIASAGTRAPAISRSAMEAGTGAQGLDGTFTTSAAALDRFATDFGGLKTCRPWAVLRPGSAEDIARMVRFARAERRVIAPRGQGHSAYGQSHADGGITIDMPALSSAPRVTGGKVTVAAGTRWREVLQATLRHGLRPPVLTNYLGLSVGGTLSVGGLDGGSYRHGAQVDNITEMQVVTGTGETLTCTAAADQDVLDAVLAGLGQCAIIVSATIELIPADRTAREYRLFYAGLQSMLLDARLMAAQGRIDRVIAFVLPGESGWTFLISAARFFSAPDNPADEYILAGLSGKAGRMTATDLPFLDFVDRRRPPDCARNPWFDVIMPAAATEPFLEEALAVARQAHRGTGDPLPAAFLAPLTRRTLSRPLLRVPDADELFVISIQQSAFDGELAQRLTFRNRKLFELARDMGGTQYAYCAVPTGPSDWRQHFGRHWERFRAAKLRYDPDGVLTPGPGIFRPPNADPISA